MQAFSYDEAHPYDAGQHRGVDIGADAAGETVIAPAAGTVSFAGTVATNGKSITIVTADGYAVTLTHLGSLLIAKGATVSEGDSVGTVGPSGAAEVAGPYVHLGIRHATDPNGYVDPLGLLPQALIPAAQDPSAGSGSSTASGSAPSVSPSSQAAPASPPARREPKSRASNLANLRSRVSKPERGRAQDERVESRSTRSARRPEVQPVDEPIARSARPASERGRTRPTASSASPRPVVETAGFAKPTVLDAGHEVGPAVVGAQPSPPRRSAPTVLPLLLNGAAAGVALAAALVAARGRRRRRPATSAPHVLHLPHREAVRRSESRAA